MKGNFKRNQRIKPSPKEVNQGIGKWRMGPFWGPQGKELIIKSNSRRKPGKPPKVKEVGIMEELPRRSLEEEFPLTS